MEKTTVYLTAEAQAALRAEARRQRRPQADLVREAVERYLAERPRPTPASVGAFASGEVAARDAKRWVRESWEGERAGRKVPDDARPARSPRGSRRPR